ncbi:MAG: hypothetical protein VKK04_24415 [Synechococcales bacterium]|nr:hypothetical protein [Synechococcales bacterium]
MMHRSRHLMSLTAGLLVAIALDGTVRSPGAIALPPPEDIPEEVARAEIILEARSPVDGEALTAAEYALLEAELAESEYPPTLSSDLQQLIFLLRVRKLLNTFIPFL